MKLLPMLIAVQSLGTVAVGGIVITRTSNPPTPPHLRKSIGEGPTHPKGSPRSHVAKEAPAATPHATEAKETEKPKDGDAKGAVESLFEGNGRFVSGHVHTHDFGTERKALLKGQHPKAIVLSCSDSRLPPELVFDQTLGELFVVRSAGNVADTIGLASMEYAAEHLHTRVLVVLGHEKCGAITAASQGGKMPSPNLDALMLELGPSLEGLKGKYTDEELVHRGVEANVAATAGEILTRSPLLARLVKDGEITVIQAVYDLDSGQVRELPKSPPVVAAHVN